MRWFAMLAVAVVCALGSPGTFTATAAPTEESDQPAPPPGLGIMLREIPEAFQDDPRAQIYIVDNVPPGTSITRAVEVSNQTGRGQPVDVYPGAAHIEDEGGFAIEEGAAVNDLTTWMHPSVSRLDMADGQSATIDLTIDVPQDAPEGEQYAVLWAQVTSGEPGDTGVMMINRVGIRVYLSVGPGNGPKPDFSIDSLTPRRNESGSHEVVADVRNTGGRALDLAGEIVLTEGPGGLSLGPKPAAGTTLAPDHSAQIVFPLDIALQPGPWNVTVTLKSGTLVRTVTGTLTFPEFGTGESVDTSTSESTTSSTTWYVVGGAFAVLIAVIAFLAYRLFTRTSTAGGSRK